MPVVDGDHHLADMADYDGMNAVWDAWIPTAMRRPAPNVQAGWPIRPGGWKWRSPPPDERGGTARPRLALIADSYARLLGQPWLMHRMIWPRRCGAPRVIVAHGTEADPVFFYGNRLALHTFDMDFASFTRLPSRYSAEPLA